MRIFLASVLLLVGLTCTNDALAETEMEMRARIARTAELALIGSDFAKLEAMARDYQTSRSRTPSGLWLLTTFYSGVLKHILATIKHLPREAAFALLEDEAAKWARQFPASPRPTIVLGMIHLQHAWEYRGDGYASTVSKESWAAFEKYARLARETLEAKKSIAAADPRWYEAMLTVAKAQSWDRDAFDALLDEALDREPAFYQSYFQALEYLLPKWHGSTREIEAFARDAVQRTAKTEGRGMYARIYWYASQTQFDTKLFTESDAAWPRMREGFDDVIARYPDAWNLNNYAKFACLAGDKEKTRELLKRIGPNHSKEAWGPPFQTQCVAWAAGK